MFFLFIRVIFEAMNESVFNRLRKETEKKRKGEKKKLPNVGNNKLRKKTINSRSQESFTFNH